MRVPSVLVALALLGLAGCLSSESDGDGTAVTDPDCALEPAGCAGNLTVPQVDARVVLDELKEFSSAYPYRQEGNTFHLAARDDLAGRLESAGLEVVRHQFPSGSYGGENILGFKWGSDRESWIVIGAHYDVTEGAVYGTYDDGSGTALVFELAKAFASIPTNRTIVFAEFDQEEKGLVGSGAFVQAVLDGTFQHNGTLVGMIDLDMIGITWPHPAHMIVWENSEALVQKIQALAVAAGMPADHVEFRESRGGSSDGLSFINAGVPTAYLWSDWDEFYGPTDEPIPYGGGYVGSYPWWHKMDTYETMMLSAGDEATLEAGFQTTLDVVSPLLAWMASPQFVGVADAE